MAKKQYNKDATKILEDLATQTFRSLEFTNPEVEASVLLLIMDGAATQILLKDNSTSTKPILESLKRKYNL